MIIILVFGSYYLFHFLVLFLIDFNILVVLKLDHSHFYDLLFEFLDVLLRLVADALALGDRG